MLRGPRQLCRNTCVPEQVKKPIDDPCCSVAIATSPDIPAVDLCRSRPARACPPAPRGLPLPRPEPVPPPAMACDWAAAAGVRAASRSGGAAASRAPLFGAGRRVLAVPQAVCRPDLGYSDWGELRAGLGSPGGFPLVPRAGSPCSAIDTIYNKNIIDSITVLVIHDCWRAVLTVFPTQSQEC